MKVPKNYAFSGIVLCIADWLGLSHKCSRASTHVPPSLTTAVSPVTIGMQTTPMLVVLLDSANETRSMSLAYFPKMNLNQFCSREHLIWIHVRKASKWPWTAKSSECTNDPVMLHFCHMNISEKHLGYTLNMRSKKGSHTSDWRGDPYWLVGLLPRNSN